MQTVRRVFPILWASAPGWTVVALVLLVLEIFFGLLTLYLIKSLVDAITTMLGTDGQAVDLRGVLIQVAWFGGATLAYLVTRAASGLAREAQGMWVADYVD
ncbi:MAG: hypothetical protein V2J10_08995, partial [Wenzhouxiangella sp.]|nr:hypothetical protein [Wenzhouxiangella sp.]